MALSKTLIALGNWIESRFPEKLTAAEVNATIAKIEYSVADLARRHEMAGDVVRGLNEANHALIARVSELEKKFDVVNSDVTKTKMMLMTQRQTTGR